MSEGKNQKGKRHGEPKKSAESKGKGEVGKVNLIEIQKVFERMHELYQQMNDLEFHFSLHLEDQNICDVLTAERKSELAFELMESSRKRTLEANAEIKKMGILKGCDDFEDDIKPKKISGVIAKIRENNKKLLNLHLKIEKMLGSK